MRLVIFLLLSAGVMVSTYLLMMFYMRRKNGVQPAYTGLVIMGVSMVCIVAIAYVLLRFDIDVRRGEPREIVWVTLGTVWLGSAARIAHQRRSSGIVLMDLGRNPLFKLHMAFAGLMLAMAVVLVINHESRAQAFGYAAWSAWFFVLARGRIQVRERGVMTNGLLAWKRITRCGATADNIVRLQLNRGLQRAVDLKLPADRRDEFVDLVSRGMA
jgi:hypothetical protein